MILTRRISDRCTYSSSPRFTTSPCKLNGPDGTKQNGNVDAVLLRLDCLSKKKSLCRAANSTSRVAMQRKNSTLLFLLYRTINQRRAGRNSILSVPQKLGEIDIFIHSRFTDYKNRKKITLSGTRLVTTCGICFNKTLTEAFRREVVKRRDFHWPIE